jgi:uncharacterized membrane protein YkvI
MTAHVAQRDRWIYLMVGAFLGFVMAALAAFEFTVSSHSGQLLTVLGVGTAGGVILGVLGAWLGEDLFEYLGELGK